MIRRKTSSIAAPLLALGLVAAASSVQADPVITTSVAQNVTPELQINVAVTTNSTADIPAFGVLEIRFDSTVLELAGFGAQIEGDLGGVDLYSNPVSTGSGDEVAVWLPLQGVLNNTNATPDLVTLVFTVLDPGATTDVSIVAPDPANDPRGLNTEPALLVSTDVNAISSTAVDNSATQGIELDAPTSVNDWMMFY